MAGARAIWAGLVVSLCLAVSPAVEGATAPGGVAAAVVRAGDWIAEQTSPQVGLPPPDAFAGPDEQAAWFTVTGGGTMQRYLGLRLADLWTGDPWRHLLRLGITLAVLLAAARLLWRQAVEGQPVAPALAALLLKLMLGYLVVYQPAWIYGMARALQSVLLATVAMAWGGAQQDAPAFAMAERLAVQRGVLEAVAARQPVILDEAAAGGGEAALAAHEGWLLERGMGEGIGPTEPDLRDPDLAGQQRARRFREVVWLQAHWVGPAGERLDLAAAGSFTGVTGVVPLGVRLEAVRTGWRAEVEAAVGSAVTADPAEALTTLRRRVREESLAYVDEAILRPALQRSLLEGVVDAMESWARHVAARLGRAVAGASGTRALAERISEAAAGALTAALGWLAAVGSQLVLELAVGAVLLAFPLSFVPGWEGGLGAAGRALLRPVVWLPAYALLAAAVDGAMGRWVEVWTAVPAEPATWGDVAAGWILPAVSPLLASVAMGLHVGLHLAILVLVTVWSGRWVGGVTGIAGWLGGWLVAGMTGMIHRAGWGGGAAASATQGTGGQAGALAPAQGAISPPESRRAPWRVGVEESVGQHAWKGSLSWDRGRPTVTWAAASARFRRRWVAAEPPGA